MWWEGRYKFMSISMNQKVLKTMCAPKIPQNRDRRSADVQTSQWMRERRGCLFPPANLNFMGRVRRLIDALLAIMKLLLKERERERERGGYPKSKMQRGLRCLSLQQQLLLLLQGSPLVRSTDVGSFRLWGNFLVVPNQNQLYWVITRM